MLGGANLQDMPCVFLSAFCSQAPRATEFHSGILLSSPGQQSPSPQPVQAAVPHLFSSSAIQEVLVKGEQAPSHKTCSQVPSPSPSKLKKCKSWNGSIPCCIQMCIKRIWAWASAKIQRALDQLQGNLRACSAASVFSTGLFLPQCSVSLMRAPCQTERGPQATVCGGEPCSSRCVHLLKWFFCRH